MILGGSWSLWNSGVRAKEEALGTLEGSSTSQHRKGPLSPAGFICLARGTLRIASGGGASTVV